MLPRNQKTFQWERRLKKEIKSFGPAIAGTVLRDVADFESVYKESETDDDIPKRYQFKPLKGIKEPYHLYEIYVGPKDQYRAILLIAEGWHDNWWIYAFKKERMREPTEIKVAKKRAKELWDSEGE